MPLTKRQGIIVYGLSVFTAMLLRIAPWPDVVGSFNPDWILLVVLYWSLEAPEQAGIFHAWFIGLLTDVLTGKLLGQHALAYVCAVYLILRMHKRLRRYPPLQQALFILLALFGAQILLFWTQNFHHPWRFRVDFWLPVMTGAICWPVLARSLSQIRSVDSSP